MGSEPGSEKAERGKRSSGLRLRRGLGVVIASFIVCCLETQPRRFSVAHQSGCEVGSIDEQCLPGRRFSRDASMPGCGQLIGAVYCQEARVKDMY